MSEPNLLDKQYDPRDVEPRIYAHWEASGAFASHPADPPTPHERTFTIVIPPPNVTGALHLGHALNNTLQDILVRYHRMRGFNTLWQPGTDHAGIATQAVVERRIREQEGKTRYQLGATEQEAREDLVRRIWKWKDEYENRILNQLKRMGCSCDWGRTRFTLDEGMSKAVREMFFRLFKDGLIFRGKRLVNWDTQLQTAVADDEVYHETVKGSFWHFKYPVLEPAPGEPEFVVIATTRPETMLGDTAVAVHPDPEGELDRRERELRDVWDRLSSRSGKEAAEIQTKLEAIASRRESHLPLLTTLSRMAREGRKVMLPLVERPIPLIADEWADPMLGTGCVKITPAHDPNDYEVWRRRPEIGIINVLTADGKIARIQDVDGSTNPHSAAYEGLDFATAGRAKVVADMELRGRIEKIEDRDIDIGHSDRSKTPIEPFLSDQWFVSTEKLPQPEDSNPDGTGLAESAMKVVESGRVRVFPERYAKSYLDWLGEKRDWCISRQLWWGHRIPVWFSPPMNLESVRRAVIVESIHNAAIVVDLRSAVTFSLDDIHNLECRDEDRFVLGVCPVSDDQVRGSAQDPDVLDTWFSSALWPFSTLGWPEQTPHLRQYYPGSVLCTSRDIITNWVARMVMFGLYAMGEVPFDHVYIHPKILDGRGETMSKSKGNGVDPVDIIDTHGADALRYTMADMCTETQDIRLPVEYVCPHCGKLTDQSIALKAEEQSRKSHGEKLDRKLQPADCKCVKCANPECKREFATQWADADTKSRLGVARETSDKFDIGRNFCNKLWNAARFAFMNLEGARCEPLGIASLPPEDRWILARLSQSIRAYHACLAAYQFSASVKELRDFFWDSLCDWYIELTKPRLGEPRDPARADAPGDPAKQVLAFCLDQVLRLWHPTIPFITERLWEQLNAIAPRRGLPGAADLRTNTPLILAEFPPVGGYSALDDVAILSTFAELQNTTRGVRDLRSRCNLSPKDTVKVTVVVPSQHLDGFRANAHIVRHMANIGELSVVSEGKRPRNAGSVTIGGVRIFVHDVSDDDAERARATKSLEAATKQIEGKQSKLSNEKFVANAKPEVVEAERQRLAELIRERDALLSHLAELGS